MKLSAAKIMNFSKSPVNSIGRTEEADDDPGYCMAQEGMLRTIRMAGATHV